MIIFYKHKKTSVIPLKTNYTKKRIESSCDNSCSISSVCTSTEIKMKKKCCFKYKKKGVNCKRCPEILQEVV